MIIKIVRVQTKVFRVNEFTYPSGSDKNRIMKTEKYLAEKSPSYFNDSIFDEITVEEMKDIIKEGDTITFNLKEGN